MTSQAGRSGDRNEADGALLAAIAERRDREAFAELFRRYAVRIKALLMRARTSRDVAEEVVREVMVTVWRKAERLDAVKASAATWIYTVARKSPHRPAPPRGALRAGPRGPSVAARTARLARTPAGRRRPRRAAARRPWPTCRRGRSSCCGWHSSQASAMPRSPSGSSCPSARQVAAAVVLRAAAQQVGRRVFGGAGR